MDEQRSAALGDEFDRSIRVLTGLPDVVKTGITNVQVKTFLDLSQMWTVQTFRKRDFDKDGKPVRGLDTIFLTYIEAGRSMRIVIPPQVAAAIARQRDQVTDKSRKKGAQQAVETRRQGIAVVAEDAKGNR